MMNVGQKVAHMDDSTPSGTAGVTNSLHLREAEPELFDRAFTGTTQPCPWPKAYGGDMVAQAAVAAMRTVGAERVLHSMHSYFMRPVDIGAIVRYEVEVLRDGRGYSTRQVRAIQDGKAVYSCLASFQVPEPDGPTWSPDPQGVVGLDVDPETLRTSAEVLEGVEPGTPEAGSVTPTSRDYWSRGRSFDMRHVPGPLYTTVEGERAPHQGVWVRAFSPILEAAEGLSIEQTHAAALAYVCDYTIIEPTLRVLGTPWAEPGLMTASLDHSMWFHHPVSVNEWLLYSQEAVSAQNGRGLGLGRFYTSEGQLVATVCQEASLRSNR